MDELVAEQLGMHFSGRVLFRRLNLTARSGSTVAITGINGSGKSTLIRILAGLVAPSAGTVRLRLGGRTVEEEHHPLHVGLVAPYLQYYDGLSAEENLRFLVRARNRRGFEDRIAGMLKAVRLADRAADPVGTFSSGMKQRLRLAAAQLFAPPLLLLDEPSTNLDTEGIAVMRKVALDHVARGGMAIIATNSDDEVALADEVIRIEDHR